MCWMVRVFGAVIVCFIHSLLLLCVYSILAGFCASKVKWMDGKVYIAVWAWIRVSDMDDS
jgi:hypothetical protein